MSTEEKALANMRKVVLGLFEYGPIDVTSLSIKTKVPRTTVYRYINNMQHIVDFTGMLPDEGRRLKFYALKPSYAQGIQMCKNAGIDILDLISYDSKK